MQCQRGDKLPAPANLGLDGTRKRDCGIVEPGQGRRTKCLGCLEYDQPRDRQNRDGGDKDKKQQIGVQANARSHLLRRQREFH